MTRKRTVSPVALPCPACGGRSYVKDSRAATYGDEQIPTMRRRRLCNKCGLRFTTYEIQEDHHAAISSSRARMRAQAQHLYEALGDMLRCDVVKSDLPTRPPGGEAT